MNRALTEEFRRSYLSRIFDLTDELMDVKMPELTEEKFALFETVGNRLEYEHDYFERRKFLTVYGCAALIRNYPDKYIGKGLSESVCGAKTPGKTDVINKLAEVIESVCNEECWALPAHVNRKDDPDWRITVDLFASETAHTLSELYNRLDGVLQEDLRRKIRAEVMRRVIIPFDSNQPYTWWERSDMNWNAVCNGSIGMAALMLLDDEPDLQARIAGRVSENLNSFLDGFSDDGACLEGLSYFTYGFGYYMGFMDMLIQKSKDNSELNGLLSDHTEVQENTAKTILENDGKYLPVKCRKIAEFQQKCYFPSGLSLSFSDGSLHEKYRIGLTCKLTSLYDTVEIPDISSAADFDFDPCYRFLTAERDLSWSAEYLQLKESDLHDCRKAQEKRVFGKSLNPDIGKAEEQERDCNKGLNNSDIEAYILPSAQWGILHGASGGGFAVKGGHNAEPHNHNDIGSFIYALGKKPVLTDLGAGEYTAQYFNNATRYDYICCSSLGHNVPVINGHGQQAGKEYACDSFRYRDSEFELSFAGAYGDDSLKELTRKISYDSDSEILTVEDIFISDGCLIEENLVTQEEVKILIGSESDQSVWTENDRQGAKMTVSDEILVGNENDYKCRIKLDSPVQIQVRKEPFVNHAGENETVKRIIWTVANKEQKGEIRNRFRIIPISKR